MATPGHKGFYVSWQSGSQQVAVMFAALVGVVLSSTIPPEKMNVWGWRVPLLLGCVIIPFLFRLRRSLKETEKFAARKHRPTTVVGRCFRAANFSVSCKDRLNRKRNGIITQPRSSGTRHPHTFIFSGGIVELSTTPTSAANMTATCWLPDC